MYLREFRPNYFVWFAHRKDLVILYSTSETVVNKSEQSGTCNEYKDDIEMMTDVNHENILSFMEVGNVV